MSECVVRMEMPKSCKKCKSTICLWVKDDDLDYMDVIEKVQDFRKKNNDVGFPDFCPIICSLPEGHGRLVDEKEVKDWVENWLCVDKYYHPYGSSKSIPMSELYDVLQRMDAAVPAERSET